MRNQTSSTDAQQVAASPSASASAPSLWEEGDNHESAEGMSNEESKDAEFETFTIKTGLRRFLRLEGDERTRFMRAVEDTVAEMTLLSFDLMKLCNLYVIRCFERQHPLVSNFGTQVFFYRLACSISTSSRQEEEKGFDDEVLEETREMYLRMRGGKRMRLASRANKTPNVSYVAKDMVVMCMNHITTNLYRRLRRWVSLQFEGHEGGDHEEMVKQAMDDIARGSRSEHVRSEHVSRVVKIVRELMGAANMPAVKDLLSSSAVSQHWTRWLRVLYRIGCDFAAVPVDGPSIRAFSLLPHCGFHARHIVIDRMQAFHQLCRMAKIPGVPGDMKKWKCSDAEACHEKLFGFRRLETCHHKYGYLLRTDGISVSVTMRRMTGGSGSSGSRMSEEDDIRACGLDLKGCAVYGLDPGRKTLFYASASPAKRSEKLWCSNREYRHRLRVLPRQHKVEKWLEREQLKKFLDDMPSFKQMTVPLLERHIRYCFTRIEDVLKFYGCAQYRKFKQNGHYTKQRVLEKMVDKITKKRRNVVLAYGSANVGSCVRHNPPIAAKAFRRRCQQKCKVVMIDEYRTSRVCSECGGNLKQMKGEKVPEHDKAPQEWKRKSIWAVQVCQDCGMVWNRDRNASINILSIFHSLISTGERPAPFRRPARKRE
jgi:hypothetical protein